MSAPAPPCGAGEADRSRTTSRRLGARRSGAHRRTRDLGRGEHRDRAGASSRPSSDPTGRARRRCCGCCSESSRSLAAAPRSSVIPRGPQAADRLPAPAPPLRAGHQDPRDRPRSSRARRRPLGAAVAPGRRRAHRAGAGARRRGRLCQASDRLALRAASSSAC